MIGHGPEDATEESIAKDLDFASIGTIDQACQLGRQILNRHRDPGLIALGLGQEVDVVTHHASKVEGNVGVLLDRLRNGYREQVADRPAVERRHIVPHGEHDVMGCPRQESSTAMRNTTLGLGSRVPFHETYFTSEKWPYQVIY